MADILEGLTEAQHEAVTHLDGPMLVVAGAGSGKTRVVTRRIAYLISKGVWADQILAMTFTNRAAGEMKQRVEALVGVVPRWLGTFHSACAKFLRTDVAKLSEGRTSQFTIYDESDQQALVKECTGALGVDASVFRPRPVLARISKAKCSRTPPSAFGSGSADDDTIARIYQVYEDRLHELDALDFDDLLVLAVRLLEDLPELRDIYHSRFRYLLVDEYQDTNRIQYDLLRLLTGTSQNVHVTGDPDQSIYSWRGAEYRNMMDFTTDFDDVRVVRLEQNYRSRAAILTAANALIRHNRERVDKELFTENPGHGSVRIVRLADERAEAEWVCERVAGLRAQGVSFRDMAVFYRTNTQSRPFEEVLVWAGIPYQIVGGLRFYERKEIKDFLAHLKLLVNPHDVVSLARVLACCATGIGPKTLARLLAASNENGDAVFTFLQRDDLAERFSGRLPARVAEFAGWCRELGAVELAPVSTCVRHVLTHSGLVEYYRERRDIEPASQDRIDNLHALADRAAEFERDHGDAALPDFLQDVALVSDVDSWDHSADCLALMTLHSSKGLEFPFVFIAGLERGLLPHQNASSPAAEEEERRLFYVGITRAQEEVAITLAARRFLWGRTQQRLESPFLLELPAEIVERTDLASQYTGW